MTYTKDKLTDMSDFEVNKVLAVLLGSKVEQHSIANIGLQWCIVYDNGGLHRIPDYCNNPSDIMPLQIEHKINVLWYTDNQEWMVMNHCAQFFDKNLLRAIACCLILVLQEKRNGL